MGILCKLWVKVFLKIYSYCLYGTIVRHALGNTTFLDLEKSKTMKKKCVYHYCNLNTFYSIISNRTLRLSDITKSNDQLEITWAVDIIREVFAEQYSELADNVKEAISREEYTKRINEKIALYFGQNELKDNFFVMCFSGQESGDLLSQWRGYGDDGKGIAIGFSEYVLKKIKDPIQMYEKQEAYILYNKVIYDKKKQKEKIEEIVLHFLREIKTDYTDIGISFEMILLKSFPRLYQEAIFMKNPFFREENESRLVISVDKVNNDTKRTDITISEKKYYMRNNQLVSCYEIGLDNIKKQMISELILGPKCQLDNNTLLNFLRDNGFGVTAESIKRSEGSYR